MEVPGLTIPVDLSLCALEGLLLKYLEAYKAYPDTVIYGLKSSDVVFKLQYGSEFRSELIRTHINYWVPIPHLSDEGFIVAGSEGIAYSPGA
jgi:hypothetical protein